MTYGPGIHKVDAETYHSDPCERPSLSSSIVNVLATSSPAHAKAAHPRLNPDLIRETADHFDVGTAAHAVLLEGNEDAVAVLDFKDWRTDAAKNARAAARAEGRVPLLAAKWEQVQAMVAAAREQIAAVTDAVPPLLVNGKPEQMLVWEEYGVTCRALVDWLHDDFRAIDDLKTTGRSADPDGWSRACFGFGAEVQAAFYTRGLQMLTGSYADFRFVVVETEPPYALVPFQMSDQAIKLANEKIDTALEVWKRCLERDEWPAYAPRIHHVELPAWMENRWLEREAREAAAWA